MSVGNLARVIAVLAACAAAAGSATSKSSSNQNDPSLASQGGQGGQNSPPPPQQMEPDRALGLWRSTFGAVKIEPDGSHGGLAAGNVQGIWMYQRQGQDVVGYFAGNLRGNVLEFRWQEPNNPPLTGEGFLVFDVQGRQYAGRWWSEKRDRIGDWNGWRQPATQGARSVGDPGQDGGQGDGYAQPAPYRRQQPYPRRPQPYQQQPYQQQPYQQHPYQQQPYQQQPYQQQPYQQQPYQQQPYQQQPYQQQPSQQQPPPPQQPPPQQQPTYYN